MNYKPYGYRFYVSVPGVQHVHRVPGLYSGLLDLIEETRESYPDATVYILYEKDGGLIWERCYKGTVGERPPGTDFWRYLTPAEVNQFKSYVFMADQPQIDGAVL